MAESAGKSASHKRLYNSLNKNFSRAAADMSILREIHLCEARLRFEKPAHGFHDLEADIYNAARAQPL